MIRKPIHLMLCVLFSISFLAACAKPTEMVTLSPPTDTQVPSTPTPTSTRKTIVVKSTADSGPNTFRQALLDAETGDVITFDPSVFPPDTPATIALSSSLPELNRGSLTIDASNAGVILDGRNITTPDSQRGLSISSDHNLIRGLQITGFSDAGIGLYGGAQYNIIGGDRSVGDGQLGQGNLISGNGNFGIGLWDEGTSHNTIQGNYIGIIIDGSVTWGHARDGIHSNGATHTSIIDNIIGGNEAAGVYLCCVLDGGNTITDNLIGVGPDGSDLGNHLGVLVDRTRHNVVGPGNTIAYNLGDGVSFWENTPNNTVTQNSIHDNGGRGIAIMSPGQSAFKPPLIINFDIKIGTLSGAACANCVVEIFSDNGDEGAIFEGQTEADENRWFTFVKGAPLAGLFLTATVTDPDGNTSEFSPPTGGNNRNLSLQVDNIFPIFLLQTKPSNELADNRIGGDYGDFSDGAYDGVFLLGLKWVRVAFDGNGSYLNWQRIEREPGKYTVNPIEDTTITALTNSGVNVILNLGVGPGDGITGTRFVTDDEIERYLNYVRFMVGYFKGRVKYYELWNEPGGITPATGLPSNIGIDVDIYAHVISQAAPIIRKEDPEAKIVIGALGGDWIYGFPGYGDYARSILHKEYLRRLITSGVAPLVDAISWHPFYGNMPDDPYYQTYPDFVREIKDFAASQGFEGEYFAEEIKYYTEPNVEGWGRSAPVVSEIVAAKYYARAIVMHLGLDFTVSTAGQPGYGGRVPDVIRALCMVMEAASPVGLPMDVQSEASNIETYSFSSSEGDRLVALWTNGVAVDDDAGVSATLTFPGSSAQKVIGIDVLHGFEQQLITETENGNLIVRNFLIKDYPIILRLIP